MSEYVALCLGGNLGCEREQFSLAVDEMRRAGLEDVRVSSIHITRPVDCVPGTPDFRNQAVIGRWPGSPRSLLHLAKSLETAAGRPINHSSRESRTLDVDIILFGRVIMDEPDLTIPHPRAAIRRFVLGPLAEIAPDMEFPDGETVAAKLAALG